MTPAALLTSPLTWGVGEVAHAGIDQISSWIRAGAAAALRETAQIIGQATAPRLTSAWFSATYWRVAGLAAVLTLPFLFAAAVQALVRSDLGLLVRAAFGYLPLALLGVSLAAPLVMLLLGATDEMCAVVSGAGSGGGVRFLDQAALVVGAGWAGGGGAFFGVALAMITVGAALALCLELLIRAAAMYVVVLMLPLAFAALVWPARRVWAVRLLELLIALILCKFVIVAVLSLAGAAFDQAGGHSISRVLVAMALVLLSTFAPWVMLRILPFTEVAAGAAGAFRAEVPRVKTGYQQMSRHLTGAPGVLPALMMARARHGGEGEGEPDVADLPLSRGGGARQAAEPSDAATGATEAGPRASTPPPPTPAPAPPPTPAPSDAVPTERLPGADAIWQAEDLTRPPMHLGPGGWFEPETEADEPG